MQRVLKVATGVGLAVLRTNCQDRNATTSKDTVGPQMQPSSALQYGVPVPPGQQLSALPEPYDYAKHGPALPNTATAAERAQQGRYHGRPQPRGFGFLRRAGRPSTQPIVTPGTAHEGWWLYPSNYNNAGIYVVNDAQTDFSIPSQIVAEAGNDGVIVYSPTHLSAGGTCLEATTIHERYLFGSGTDHAHGFWDWCNDRGNPYPGSGGTAWAIKEYMDAVWTDKYVRIMQNELRFIVQVYSENPANPAGSCWVGLIYNFAIGHWEEKARACGFTRIGHNNGWTMWEEYNLTTNSCPTVPNISAYSIMTQGSNGTWYAMDYSNPVRMRDSRCFTEGRWWFESPHGTLGSNAWEAHTPN